MLLDLQGLKAGAFLGQVRIDQIADAGFQRVRQLTDIGGVAFDLLGLGAQFGQTRTAGGDGGVDGGQSRRGVGLAGQGRAGQRQTGDGQVLTIQRDGFCAVGAGQEVQCRRRRTV